MINEDIVTKMVEQALEKGADYAEARLQTDSIQNLMLRNGTPETFGVDERAGLNVRVLIDGAMGFASTDQWEKKAVRKDTIQHAIKLARVQEGGEISLSKERVVRGSYHLKAKQDPASISIQEKLDRLNEWDSIILDAADINYPRRMLSMRFQTTEKTFANSDGTLITSSIPRTMVSIFFVGVHNGDNENLSISKGEAKGWEALDDFKLPREIDEKSKLLANVLKEAENPPEEEMDLILGPHVAGLATHESVGHPYEADRILGRESAQAGESFVHPDMLGEKIGSDIVTVIDDPTLSHSYGFYQYDEEGVRAQPRYLIQHGRINDLLHNRETAAVFNVKSNGASRANFFNREPIVRMGNTYIARGNVDFDEILEDTDRGLWIERFGEWNIDDRRWKMRFKGKISWLVENGERTKMIRDPVLDITSKGFWSSVVDVANDLSFDAATCGKGDPGQGVPVWHGAPHIKLEGIKILAP